MGHKSDIKSSSNFFDDVSFLLVRFSYWCKVHVNIITGSGVITSFFYKGLTRNPKIGNISVWFFRSIWRLEQIRYTKFGKNVFNEILLNVAKWHGYSFYHFWVINGKPTGLGGGVTHIHPPRLGLVSVLLPREI